MLLVGAAVWSVVSVDWGGPILHTGGLAALADFLLALFPPELSLDFLGLAVSATWQTLAFAVAGITLAVLLGLPLGVIASGATSGSSRGWIAVTIAGARFFLAAIRSIHELVWAVLFLAAFGLSSLTAVLAIAQIVGEPPAGFEPKDVSWPTRDVEERAVRAFIADRALREESAKELRERFGGTAVWTDQDRRKTLEGMLEHADPLNGQRAQEQLDAME